MSAIRPAAAEIDRIISDWQLKRWETPIIIRFRKAFTFARQDIVDAEAEFLVIGYFRIQQQIVLPIAGSAVHPYTLWSLGGLLSGHAEMRFLQFQHNFCRVGYDSRTQYHLTPEDLPGDPNDCVPGKSG